MPTACICCVVIITGAHYTVAAWPALRRLGNRRQSPDPWSARDAEPSFAADDRGHRELVEISEASARRQTDGQQQRDVNGAQQRRCGWSRNIDRLG